MATISIPGLATAQRQVGPRSLHRMSMKVAIREISAIYDIGDLPFELAEPILDRIDDPVQLEEITANCPQIAIESDKMNDKAKTLLEKRFPNWREKYTADVDDTMSYNRVHCYLVQARAEEEQAAQDRLADQMAKAAGYGQAKKFILTKGEEARIRPRSGYTSSSGWGRSSNSNSTSKLTQFRHASAKVKKTFAQTKTKASIPDAQSQIPYAPPAMLQDHIRKKEAAQAARARIVPPRKKTTTIAAAQANGAFMDHISPEQRQDLREREARLTAAKGVRGPQNPPMKPAQSTNLALVVPDDVARERERRLLAAKSAQGPQSSPTKPASPTEITPDMRNRLAAGSNASLAAPIVPDDVARERERRLLAIKNAGTKRQAPDDAAVPDDVMRERERRLLAVKSGGTKRPAQDDAAAGEMPSKRARTDGTTFPGSPPTTAAGSITTNTIPKPSVSSSAGPSVLRRGGLLTNAHGTFRKGGTVRWVTETITKKSKTKANSPGSASNKSSPRESASPKTADSSNEVAAKLIPDPPTPPPPAPTVLRRGGLLTNAHGTFRKGGTVRLVTETTTKRGTTTASTIIKGPDNESSPRESASPKTADSPKEVAEKLKSEAAKIIARKAAAAEDKVSADTKSAAPARPRRADPFKKRKASYFM